MELDKLRVLQIVRGLDIGGDSGGAERFGVELARALNRMDNFEVMICAFFELGTKTEVYWRDLLAREGIETFFATQWGGYHNLSNYLKGLRTLLKRLGSRHVDICHSHFQLGSLTALYLKMSGRARRAVRTAHISKEWNLGKYSWWLNNIFIKYLFPVLLDAEVGVSQALVDYLSCHPGARLAQRKPRLIYNAVFLSEIEVNDNEFLFFQMKHRNGFLVGSVGRLTTQKGFTYLLEAVPQVLNSFPDVHFVIIGEGELRAELEEQSRHLGIEDRVMFLGSRTDVPSLLRQMDLFVLPSLWEGLPTVIMEAMACGVPVIATDIPGTNEIVQDGITGWLVPEKNPDRIAEAIIFALDNHQARERVCQNAKKNLNRYSIEEVARQYSDLYKELMH